MQCALFLAAAVAILLARTCAAQNTLGSCKGTTIDPRVWTIDPSKNNHIDVTPTSSPAYSATMAKAASAKNLGYDGQAVTVLPVTEVSAVGHTYQTDWGSSVKHFRMGLSYDKTPSAGLSSPYQLTLFVGRVYGGKNNNQRVLVVEKNAEKVITIAAGLNPSLALKVENGFIAAHINGKKVHQFASAPNAPLYAKVYFHDKKFELTKFVVKHDNCQKVLDASKYGTTTTTTTMTTTTNTILDALHKRVDELEGADATSKLAGIVKLQEMQLEAMAKKQNETSAKLAATAAELKEAKARLADATSNLDAASLNFAARLDALEARSGGTFALDASTGSGCAGSQCAPEVAADAADLVLSAASGTIKMDTEKCGVVDACELAQAVADNAKALGAL